MAARIHPTAIVAPGARLADGVEIGPWCRVGPDVVIGKDSVLEGPSVLDGRIVLGERVRVFPFVSIHHHPQDLKYRGEESRVEVGDDAQIREHTSVHAGTEGGGLVTRIGRRNLIMTGIHFAHDVCTEDDVVVGSSSAIGGHVHIESQAVIGGSVAMHHFVRIGTLAMVSMSRVLGDVPPYALLGRNGLLGVNLVGLRRRGYAPAAIRELQAGYRRLFPPLGVAGERAERSYTGRLAELTEDCAGRSGPEAELLGDLLDYLNRRRVEGRIGHRPLELALFTRNEASEDGEASEGGGEEGGGGGATGGAGDARDG